ncbi:MAG: hypothetical protein KKH41_00600 [Candidatus Thermoplasmatota archaeon]|nr:hypothetical protein [Euryarchaeota archaeon]MBU4031662.1 hypothetical protein [Candidatus Thermoplasmatota archaeon]MBU4145312.1 hypothetical protein [Candidatus Thermoplasmatota archaeon]MBU4591061.1 hypothetical protein [Candidatus Thermoplasmatota archaeon]
MVSKKRPSVKLDSGGDYITKVNTTDFGFITFEPDDLPVIVNNLGMNFNRNGYLEKNRETVFCHSCNKAITKERIGHILPGSEIVCCANPICFAMYVDEYLED